VVSFGVPQPAEYSRKTDLKEEYITCTLQSRIYILHANRLCSIRYIAE
jgi:hypothetical protein